MDLSRAVYSRDLKIATMRALDAGSATGEIARKYQLSPKLLERWRGEWRQGRISVSRHWAAARRLAGAR
jgi:transposase-like protein